MGSHLVKLEQEALALMNSGKKTVILRTRSKLI